MFEKDDDGVARIWRNGALQLMRQSGEHADNAAAWAKNAREWKAHALGLTDENANLKAQLAAAQLALALKTADAEGLEAHKTAFINAHPQSPVRADSGKRYKDGSIKTKGRLIYEAAFDRILREAGIADPAKHRAD
jgi:hypothetical protein